MVDIQEIEGAAARTALLLSPSPVLRSGILDRLCKASLFLKCENLQKTGSFKSRGALNAVLSMDSAQKERGVVTVSAGNFAQALAWGSASANVNCTVVMPASASRSKVDATEGYGATVFFENDAAAAFQRADHIARETGRLFIHPFDDPAVVAGAGTVAVEFIEQVPELDVLVVPVGGGGLISGMAVAARAQSPNTRIIGVEPSGAAAMSLSLQEGRAMRLPVPPQTVADGLAAPMAGALNFAIVREHVSNLVLVEDADILDAMRLVITRCKLLVEPAAAAGLAALIAGKIEVGPDSRVGVVLSGGNVDLNRLAGC